MSLIDVASKAPWFKSSRPAASKRSRVKRLRACFAGSTRSAVFALSLNLASCARTPSAAAGPRLTHLLVNTKRHTLDHIDNMNINSYSYYPQGADFEIRSAPRFAFASRTSRRDSEWPRHESLRFMLSLPMPPSGIRSTSFSALSVSPLGLDRSRSSEKSIDRFRRE